MFLLRDSTTTVVGAGLPRSAPVSQIALETAVDLSSATRDRMSPLIFIITKCNSDIHRQEAWQQDICVTTTFAMRQLCPQKWKATIFSFNFPFFKRDDKINMLAWC